MPISCVCAALKGLPLQLNYSWKMSLPAVCRCVAWPLDCGVRFGPASAWSRRWKATSICVDAWVEVETTYVTHGGSRQGSHTVCQGQAAPNPHGWPDENTQGMEACFLPHASSPHPGSSGPQRDYVRTLREPLMAPGSACKCVSCANARNCTATRLRRCVIGA